jgi:hypothetical protein
MGLDNAVCIKRNAYTNSIPELKRFEDDWDKKHELDFSICYWRKNWGLRNDILYLIGKRFAPDTYEFDLTKDDVVHIIDLLKSYNSKTWVDSIWDWDDEEYPYSEKIQRDIVNLQLLRELMDQYNLEVYFYDSY